MVNNMRAITQYLVLVLVLVIREGWCFITISEFQSVKSIPEDSTESTLITKTTARTDSKNTIYYYYEVEPADGPSKFTWDYETGELRTIANPQFDYETRPEYKFEVTASTGAQSVTRPFTLTIEDVNEQPVIRNLPDSLKLDENDPGDRSIFTLSTTDPDPDDKSWTYNAVVVPPGTSDKFIFNKKNFENQIWLKKGPDLDYEEYQNYNLSITASDGRLTSVPKYLHMEIRDINEEPFFTDQAATATIYEESPIGTTLVTSIGPPRALDPDKLKNDTVTYILEGQYSDYFDIHTYNEEAVITLAERLDRESVDEPIVGPFKLYVSAIDRMSLRQDKSNTFIITVDVIDVNDHPTVCDKNIYQGSIKENSPIDTSILTISCTDSDNVKEWPIQYRVNTTGLPMKYFYFPSSATNQLSAKYPMDMEQGELLTFIVDVVQGAPYNSSTTTVTVQISVLGENDNRPNMSRPFYNFEFRYDADINTVVGQVAASDADVPTSTVTFDWVYAVTEFYMTTSTGVIATKTTFVTNQKFVYYAIAQDNDKPPDVSTASPVRIDTFDPQLYLVDFEVAQPISYFTEAKKQEFEDAISSACPPCLGRISSLQQTSGNPTTTTIRVYALTDSSTESLQNVGQKKTYIPKTTMLDIFTIDSHGTPSSAVALPGFFNFPVIKVNPTQFGLTFLEWLLYTVEGNLTLALVCLAVFCSLIATLVYLWRIGALKRLFQVLMMCNLSSLGNICKDCCKPSESPVTRINRPEQIGDFNVFDFRYKNDMPLANVKKNS